MKLNSEIVYFKLSYKINILKYRKYELTTESETVINCSSVTAVTVQTALHLPYNYYSSEQMLLADRPTVSNAATP